MENEPSTPPSQTPPSASESEVKSNSNTFGMLCHLLAFCGLLGVPFGNILGPLVMWLIKREESPFVDACGKEALNFQISMTIYTLISGLLVLAAVGLVLLPAIIIVNVIFTIIASIRASEGKHYEYPLTIRFVK